LPQGRLRGWIVAAVLLWAPAALAQQPSIAVSKNPVLITADQVTYDRDLGVVVANGHVEVSQDDRVLRADTLTYNERTKTVTASGNVALVDTSGSVAFADYMEVTDDLKNGVIHNIKMLLNDKSRIAAVQASRKGPTDEFNKGVYSPCRPCAKDPLSPPIWQLKSRRIVHDNDAHDIVYHDAWMEFFGVPVIYTPYFSTPDPTVKRRSGFLAPVFGNSSNLGFQYQQPYFWAIAPDKDLTVAPLINTAAPPVLIGEYRQRIVNGKFKIDAAATALDISNYGTNVEPTGTNFEGYLFSDGQLDLSRNWRAGYDVNLTTDPAFLRLFNFQHAYDNALNSEVYGEGFDGRSYASIQGWAFQTMQQNGIQNSQLPIVTPVIDYNLVGEPNKFGAYWSVSANTMVLTRVDGTDSRRLLAQVGWTLPYVAPAGDIYKLSVSLRADGYWVDDVDTASNTNPYPAPTVNTFSGLTGRVFPQISFDWRYPFVRRTGHTSQVFEPIFSAVASPNGANPNTIPNEDSQDFQFDETNLFDSSRVTGYDLVDSGQRISYGAKYSIYGDEGGSTSLFLGQSYQIGPLNAYDVGVGLGNSFSDVVGALRVSPTSSLDLLYRFRLDASTGIFRRQEISAQFGTARLSANVSYVFLNGLSPAISNSSQQQEIYATIRSQIDDNWSFVAHLRRDLETDMNLDYGAGIGYKNDCISVDLEGSRNNYTGTNINPGTTVLLTIGFKNLGNYGLSF
jgi:LPS-assembly protein